MDQTLHRSRLFYESDFISAIAHTCHAFLSVQTDAEQGAEPLFRVQPIRQPDLRVYLLHFSR